MNHREVTTAVTSSLVALSTTSRAEEHPLVSIVDHHDENLPQRMDTQVTQTWSRWCGACPDTWGLHHSHLAAGLLKEGAGAFFHPESRVHKSEHLYERMELAAGFLLRSQRRCERFKTKICLIVLCLSFVVFAKGGQTDTCPTCGITNPLIEQRADPWCLKHTDGHYYFIATVPEYDRIELRRASTITGLRDADPKVIWRKHDTGPMSYHIWAPEIHHINGQWYVYFAAGRAEDIWAIRMYVLECTSSDPLTGQWIEKGQLKTNWESFSLDATTFEHNETRYLVWAQKDPNIRGNTNLYIAKMDSPWSITGRQVMITRPECDWECIGYWVNEGPAVLIRNGRIFISYSASATDHHYCMGLLTADETADLLDPKSWHKSPIPVFKSSESTGQYGPGHNSFTIASDGKTDLIVYHARNYKEIQGDPLRNPDRHTRVQKLNWTPDGTPDFGEPVPDGVYPCEHLTKKEPLRLAIIGDSTVCEYPPNHACRGWGQYIQEYFKDTIRVINLAKSGRSTKTFINQGLWAKTLETKPDIVLIQFGHNDSHAPDRPES
ncbi:MAG: family 43 glycosylhydrolase, partial [Sedimentisphaerales bacterium]|nr:family 43 glycosylhydrolase [Sedimentisphaerales bacterium]